MHQQDKLVQGIPTKSDRLMTDYIKIEYTYSPVRQRNLNTDMTETEVQHFSYVLLQACIEHYSYRECKYSAPC